MITATVQAKNAIKWIDSLNGGKKGFRKGIGCLGQRDYVGNVVSYCCLGVGCKILGIEPKSWGDGASEPFAVKVGLHTAGGYMYDPVTGVLDPNNCVTHTNDVTYSSDSTFTNMRKFILKNLKYIFKPKVAEKLEAHYNKK